MRRIHWHLKKTIGEYWNHWIKRFPFSGRSSPSKVVATGRRASKSTITYTKTFSTNLYRRIKIRMGRSFRGIHWSLPENKLQINYLELKVVFLALGEFHYLCLNNIALIATDNTTVVAYRNKDGGDEIVPPVCPTMKNPDLELQETGYCQSPTHSRQAECYGRQAIQARPDHLDKMVPPSRDLPGNMVLIAAAPSGTQAAILSRVVDILQDC